MFSRYLVTVALLFFSSLTWASPGRWVMGANTDTPLAALEDRGGHLSVEQVAAMPDAAFRPLSGGLAAGYTPSVYWLKFSPPAANATTEMLLELMPSYIDEIILFEPDGNGWRARVTGDLRPYAEREFAYRNFMLYLKPADPSAPRFLRVRSSSSVMLYGTFWKPADFAGAVVPEAIIAGLFFGIIGLSVLLAFAYGAWLRSRVFLMFALTFTLAALLVAAINGFHAQLLFPAAPLLASLSVGVLNFLAQGARLLLSAELLETAKYFPRFNRVLRIGAFITVACTPFAFTDYFPQAIMPVFVVTWLMDIGGLIACFSLVRKGAPAARILTFTYALHIVALAATLSLIFGVVRPNFTLSYAWQAEILLHALLIHGAMLWRVRKNEEQHHRAQQQALTASQEAERMLETRVCERTQALTVAHNRLEAALASEQRTLLEQRQFMSMVSHEFRTPLAIIDSVAVNLTEIPVTDSADTAARAEQLRRATRRLARLVDNCLTDERVDHAAFSLQLETLSPAALVREAAEIVNLPSRHRLVLALDGLPGSIECDPTLIRIALSNLLDNAVKYSEGGTVELTGSADDSHVKFAVGDEGAGLKDADIEQLFERFARGTAKKAGGAGLGLFVARRIARLHGGDVTAHNKPGGGAVFEFEIRRRVSAAVPD